MGAIPSMYTDEYCSKVAREHAERMKKRNQNNDDYIDVDYIDVSATGDVKLIENKNGN